jgi:hypothetical protein
LTCLVGAVQRCLDAGVIGPGDPVQIAVVVSAGVHGVTSQLISKSTLPRPEPDAVANSMCDVLIDGLRRR